MGVNNQQTKAGNGNQRHRPGNKRGAARLKRAQIIKQPLRIVHRNRTPPPIRHHNGRNHQQRISQPQCRMRALTLNIGQRQRRFGNGRHRMLGNIVMFGNIVGHGRNTIGPRIDFSLHLTARLLVDRLFLHAGIHRHLRLPRVRCSTPHLSAQCVVSCRDAHARTVLYRECAIR